MDIVVINDIIISGGPSMKRFRFQDCTNCPVLRLTSRLHVARSSRSLLSTIHLNGSHMTVLFHRILLPVAPTHSPVIV